MFFDKYLLLLAKEYMPRYIKPKPPINPTGLGPKNKLSVLLINRVDGLYISIALRDTWKIVDAQTLFVERK